MALNSLICADVPLRNCSLTHHCVAWLSTETFGWGHQPLSAQQNLLAVVWLQTFVLVIIAHRNFTVSADFFADITFS